MAEEQTQKVTQVLDNIKTFNVLELVELVKAFEDEFGVTAAAPAAVVVAAPAAEAEEEKTAFDVVLTVVGSQKIQVIKEVRAITSLGLKEAKALVDGAPKAIKEGVSKDEANEIKEKIEKAGGSVEIK